MAATLRVSPRIIRAHPDQPIDSLYRLGPCTLDGVWLVHRFRDVAVWVVEDPLVEKLSSVRFGHLLDDACRAEEIDAQDAFLASLPLKPVALARAVAEQVHELNAIARDRLRAGG